MKYKLIAVDMDGTLLDNQKKIAPATVSAIKRVVEQGVLFVVATGRSVRGMAKYQQILGLPGPVVIYNGAMIVRGGEVLFEQGLRSDDARRIFALGQRYDTTMCIWSGNQLYGNRLDERIVKYQELAGMEALLLNDIEDVLEVGVTKMLWYDEPERIEQYERELRANTLADMFGEVNFCTSQPIFMEFFNGQVSKGAAIAKIGEMYGIAQEEMIAVGDGLNDQSMLEYAGLGVAMANADPKLKACAQYIADSNENEGVRKLLEKFF